MSAGEARREPSIDSDLRLERHVGRSHAPRATARRPARASRGGDRDGGSRRPRTAAGEVVRRGVRATGHVVEGAGAGRPTASSIAEPVASRRSMRSVWRRASRAFDRSCSPLTGLGAPCSLSSGRRRPDPTTRILAEPRVLAPGEPAGGLTVRSRASSRVSSPASTPPPPVADRATCGPPSASPRRATARPLGDEPGVEHRIDPLRDRSSSVGRSMSTPGSAPWCGSVLQPRERGGERSAGDLDDLERADDAPAVVDFDPVSCCRVDRPQPLVQCGGTDVPRAPPPAAGVRRRRSGELRNRSRDRARV